MIPYFLMTFTLFLIAYQDFKYRCINLWILILFLVAAMAIGIQAIGIAAIFKNALLNCSFIGLQLILVSAYFSIKSKKWINITAQQIGWGDILFFLPLSYLLAPGWFIIFYTISLMLVLFFYLFFKMAFNLNPKTIPLAGGQALCFIVLGLAKWRIGFNLYEELSFLSRINI